jgi:hypothetical protein
MKENTQLQIDNNSDTLTFHSDEYPLLIKHTIRWRGLSFKVKATGYSRLSAHFDCYYKRKHYSREHFTHRGYLGKRGDLPEIKKGNHYIKISFYGNSIVFEDMVSEPNLVRTASTSTIFKVSATPDPPFAYLVALTRSRKRMVEVWVRRMLTLLKSRLRSVRETDELTLYEYHDARLDMNSKVYFDNRGLIIDQWKLTDTYEDEESMIIRPAQLAGLFSEFNIANYNKKKLLVRLLKAFKGEDGFTKAKSFLDKSNIKYDTSARYE